MRSRRVVLRLLAALVAVVQGFAPGTASIIDARPAALALSENAVTHFEEPGSPHAIAHEEHCVLCSAATQLPAEPLQPTPRRHRRCVLAVARRLVRTRVSSSGMATSGHAPRPPE
ncbi:MAG: hypothetical protein IPP20_16245 [Gemmatimonadetes bacterium]|nr:hypothetical protein [Gemmatimonadota bacterium]